MHARQLLDSIPPFRLESARATVKLRASPYVKGGQLSIDVLIVEADGGRMHRGEKWGRLTCNLPGEVLAPSEIAIKTWGENEDWYAEALEQIPYAEDTGKRIVQGSGQVEVWRLVEVEP